MNGANQKRDLRLRRNILVRLYFARATPKGGISGITLMDSADDGLPWDMQFVDETHAHGLMRDLVLAGLATEEKLTRRRGEMYGLSHSIFRITEAGVSLCTEVSEPHPLVWDERVIDE